MESGMGRSSMLQQRSTAWGALPLMLGFCATGVGVALPGALLPVLQARWHLQDERAGRLFLVAWIGSSLGALVVRESLRTTLLLGALAACTASAGLARCTGDEALLFMTLFGFGLGAVMTSISLIRQQQTMRQRNGVGTTESRLGTRCLSHPFTYHPRPRG